MNSLSIDFLQASTQSKGSHVKSHAGLHKFFLFMETSAQPRGYHGKSQDFLWTSSLESSSHYPEDLMGSHRFSHRLSLHSVFTLAGRSHGKSKDFPYDSVSWRPLHSPGDASRIPRISHGVCFYRGLYISRVHWKSK